MFFFSIADIPFALEGDGESCVFAARSYLERYAVDADLYKNDKKTVHWSIRPLDQPPSSAAELLAHADVMKEDEGWRILVHGGATAKVSADGRRVHMELSRHAISSDPYFIWVPLSTMLRIYLSLILPMQGGLLLHAASIEDGGLGRVFAGPSGAGKSTISDLSSPRPVFNDEVTILRSSDDGWSVWPSPFFSNLDRPNRSGEPLSLDRVYLIEKAREDRLEDLSSIDALAELLACVMNFRNGPAMASRLLDLCTDLLSRHPSKRLYFRKTPEFWRLLG